MNFISKTIYTLKKEIEELGDVNKDIKLINKKVALERELNRATKIHTEESKRKWKECLESLNTIEEELFKNRLKIYNLIEEDKKEEAISYKKTNTILKRKISKLKTMVWRYENAFLSEL